MASAISPLRHDGGEIAQSGLGEIAQSGDVVRVGVVPVAGTVGRYRAVNPDSSRSMSQVSRPGSTREPTSHMRKLRSACDSLSVRSTCTISVLNGGKRLRGA